MPSSNDLATDNSENWRPDAPRMTAVPRRDLSLLSFEERITYRKWRRATLAVYAAVAIVFAAVSIAIGPTDISPRSEIYSALAPPSGHDSHR